jgi:hypothetical protein
MRKESITRKGFQYVETKSCQILLAKVLRTFEITLVNELLSVGKFINLPVKAYLLLTTQRQAL